MMTSPLVPAGPRWMWAAVPLTPVVLMLPAIDWSAATVIVPLPVAVVVTGGTSWLPLSVTLTSTAEATPTPIAMRIAITPNIAASVRLIEYLLLILGLGPATQPQAGPHGSRGGAVRIVKLSATWARRSEASASAGVPAREKMKP